jgi:hypothetical protein
MVMIWPGYSAGVTAELVETGVVEIREHAREETKETREKYEMKGVHRERGK